MNPNAPQPSFELPPLPNESVSGQPGIAPEISANKEAAPRPPLAQPLPMPDPAVLQQGSNPAAPPLQPAPVSSQASALDAEDGDLIEKEWVLKAKQIVAATREDPHAQNRELSKIKADYLKKRYGKDIKVDES